MAGAAREERLPDGSTVDELWEYLSEKFAYSTKTPFTAERYINFLNDLLITISLRFKWRGECLAFQFEGNTVVMTGEEYDLVVPQTSPRVSSRHNLISAVEFTGAKYDETLKAFFLAACKAITMSMEAKPRHRLYLNCEAYPPEKRLLLLFAHAVIDALPHVNRREWLLLELKRTPLEARFLSKVAGFKNGLVVEDVIEARHTSEHSSSRLLSTRPQGGLRRWGGLRLTLGNIRTDDHSQRELATAPAGIQALDATTNSSGEAKESVPAPAPVPATEQADNSNHTWQCCAFLTCLFPYAFDAGTDPQAIANGLYHAIVEMT